MRRFRRLVNSLVLGSLFALLMAGVFGFLIERVLHERTSFRETRVQLAEVEAKARRVDALRTRWKKVETEAGVIESAFLAKDQLPNFLASIEATAASAGVREDTSIAEEAEGHIRFHLHINGTFSDLFIFVTHLNVLPTLIFVEDVSFHAPSAVGGASGASDATKPSVDMTIRVPLRGLGGGMGKAADPASVEESTDKNL